MGKSAEQYIVKMKYLFDTHVFISDATHDALFDDEPVITNGTNHTMSDSLPVASQEEVTTSEVLAAEDVSVAPVEHVEAGITPVTSYLPDHNLTIAPAADSAEPAPTTTEPPAIEQAVSDARDEPLPDALEAPVEQLEPLSTEPSALVTTTSPFAEASPTPAEDRMDVSEDAPVSAEEPSTSQMQIDEPVPSIEPSALEIVPSITAPSAEQTITVPQSTVTIGQVRQREEDSEEEPSAKRAKTESTDGAFPAQDVPMASTEVAAPASAPANVAPVTAPSTSVAPATAKPVSLDSGDLTQMQQKFLLEQIRKAKKTKNAFNFNSAVDWVALGIPNYPEVIKHPMDLSTMERNLKENKYGSADELMSDFEQMIENTIIFNGTAHAVSQAGQSLKAYWVKCVSGLPKRTAGVPAKKADPPPPKITRPVRAPTVVATSPTENRTAGFLDQDGNPIIRRGTAKPTDDRPKRPIKAPNRLPYAATKPKKKKSQLELKFCEIVLKEMNKSKHAAFTYAFLNPVDPVALNIPNYLRIIKKPMDLGTVANNLKNGDYENAKAFYNDCKLIFSNCYKFNPPTDEVYKMGKATEALFEMEWERKDSWMADNQPQSEPVSEDEEEEDEEDVEPEDPQLRRMQEIQAQIAALSHEAMQITTAAVVKRPSPKAASKKAAKPGVSHKAKRPSIAAPVPVKAVKAKSKPKPKKLTLDQKREVSEGIANLDEAKMRKAVQIIRNGVPALAVSLIFPLC